MKRRNFIKTTALGSMALGITSWYQQPKTHILTLSFDDGFKKSFYKIAEIHEKFGLMACLNIIASAHITKNENLNEYHKYPVGNFDDWNKLKSRGHEIMPHSWDHSNLKEVPLEKVKEDIERCISYFEKNLDGYKSSEAVYNFAYNASTPELVNFVLTKVRAVRTGGWDILGKDTMINPFPKNGNPVRLGCWSFGPENADKWVEQEVSKFLRGPKGWLILNLHGLDEEGWGPVSSVYLEKLLERLVKIDYLDVLPAGIVLDKY